MQNILSTLPVTLALCIMLSMTYYGQTYAGKIDSSQLYNGLSPKRLQMVTGFVRSLKLHTFDFWTITLHNFDKLESSPPHVNIMVKRRWNSESQVVWLPWFLHRLYVCMGFKSPLGRVFFYFQIFKVLV